MIKELHFALGEFRARLAAVKNEMVRGESAFCFSQIRRASPSRGDDQSDAPRHDHGLPHLREGFARSVADGRSSLDADQIVQRGHTIRLLYQCTTQKNKTAPPAKYCRTDGLVARRRASTLGLFLGGTMR